MISCIGTPSACEKSRTVTPDSTNAGPVGGAIGWSDFGSSNPWELAQPLMRGAQRRVRRQFRLELQAAHGVELTVDIGMQGAGGFFGSHLCAFIWIP